MDKILLYLAPVVSLIPWLFPSVNWLWKLAITLIILTVTCIIYGYLIKLQMNKVKRELEDQKKQIIKLNNHNKELKKAFEQEENNRKKVAHLYGSCERDSEKFIADIRETRQDLYQVYRLLNQSKTRKDVDLIKELGRISGSIQEIIERENKYGRERSISDYQDY